GVQPILFEVRAEQRPVRRGLRHDPAAPPDRDRRHQPTSTIGAGAGRANIAAVAAWRARDASTAPARPVPNGPRTTPSSVTMPVMSSAGVTSKDGFRTSV